MNIFESVNRFGALMEDGYHEVDYPDGNRYEGEFKDGKRHGHGVYTFGMGDRYEGDYKDDKEHGQGVYTSPDGVRYEGDYKDGKVHGQGVYTNPDGERFEGDHKDGKRHGQGVLTFADGNIYEGEFKDGKYNGQGVLTNADGTRNEGKWKDGIRVYRKTKFKAIVDEKKYFIRIFLGSFFSPIALGFTWYYLSPDSEIILVLCVSWILFDCLFLTRQGRKEGSYNDENKIKCIKCKSIIKKEVLHKKSFYEILSVSDSTRAVTTRNRISGISRSNNQGSIVEGSYNSTSYVPVKIGRVRWTIQCYKCERNYVWTQEMDIKQWTDLNGKISYELSSSTSIPLIKPD